MGFVLANGSSKLGEQTVGSEWERGRRTVFMGFGEQELGGIGGLD